MDFVNLHNHSHFSILDSLIAPKDLFLRTKELGQNAVAITDHGTLSSAWEAYKVSKEVGIKLIIGCELYFLNDIENKSERIRHIILLAKNAIGYKNLLTLNRKGFDSNIQFGKRAFSVIDWKLLEKYSEGLICLTSCGSGIIGQLINNKKFEEAEIQLNKLIEIFGENLGVEVQANSTKNTANHYQDANEQAFVNFHSIRLAKKLGVKVVPTCNAHYLKKEDHEIHDTLLAIGSGQPHYSNSRIKYHVSDFYLKSGEEVKDFFARNFGEDYANEICENTILFANMCENPDWIDLKYTNPSGKELPSFPVEDEEDFPHFKKWLLSQSEEVQNLDLDKSYLRYVCFTNLLKKIPENKHAEYIERLNEELEVIEYHGFSSYMLIVADYINYARKNKIRVGLGRGSVGGSLIAYLQGIHYADPIKYKLIFARFHNKEKTSFPDIDTDFAPSGRDRVKEYVKSKYGEERVAHVSNINTITPKVYARDIARARQFGGTREEAVRIGTEIADTIPAQFKNIDTAFEGSPLFAEYARTKYTDLKKFSTICGKYRAWATHAGGLIIAKRPLTGLIPVRKDKDGSVAIEYDKEKAEENGLVKMDMLSLSTLDIIDNTYELIKSLGKPLPSDIPDFDEYDKLTYDLISSGNTFCVFQLGTSSGTIDLCKNLKPKNIEDISHINALARPSARDIREGFIQAKEGKKKVQLLHPSLKRAFGPTFGFGLYEESLMYLAQDVAGWSLHEADRLRKLTKEKGKNPKKAAAWKKEFIDNALNKNKIPTEISTKIWEDVVEKFQGYGFNISHSILYSMISYHTAYLKAHYPVEFLLANLISEIKSNMKSSRPNIEKIKNEIRSYNIKIVPPSINDSKLSYTLTKEGNLLTGLDALKFVGDDAILDIISKRPFKNFFDFMVRVDSKKVRANTIQALAATGCLDSFGLTRKNIFFYCSDFRKKLQVWLKKHDPSKEEMSYPFPNDKEWSIPELYALEKFYAGEAFICGKDLAYGEFFANRDYADIGMIKSYQDKKQISSIRAEVKSVFEFKVKKDGSKYFGKPMVKATIEGTDGEQIGLTIFPDTWEQVRDAMKRQSKGKHTFSEGIVISFSGTTNRYEDEVGIILDTFYKYSPHPLPPPDLKAKKVSLAREKGSKEEVKETEKENDIYNSDKILQDLEDELYDQGLLDLDIEEDD